MAGDGTRLLVISTNEQGTDAQLGVSGIQRLPNGQPTALAAPLRQAQALALLTDVVWLDTTRSTYAVLGQLRAGDPEQPWVGTVGMGLEGIRSHGRSTAKSAQAAAVPGAVSITTVGGPRGIVITTADGWVWARAGSAWRQAVRGTDVLVPAR